MSEIIPSESLCYGIKMRRASNALTKFYDKALEPANLTVSQFSLLSDIKILGSCNKSELAQYAKLDRTTIVRNLNVLCEKGLITATKIPDRQCRLMQLTPLGEAKTEEGYSLWKQAQRRVKETLGTGNIESLMQMLTKITQLD